MSSIRSSLSLHDTVEIYASYDVASPLYAFIAFFWYRILPHTEQAIRAISIILSLLACMITGLTAKKLFGSFAGIAAYLFMICNTTVQYKAIFEFRHYSLLILAASINLYLYMCRLRNESWINVLLYGFTMALFPYTHYVSVLFCIGLFIADCGLIFRKIASPRVIFSYFIGALLFIPWLYVLLSSRSISDFGTFWPSAPSFRDLIGLNQWLTGSASFMAIQLWLAMCGFVLAVRRAVKGENSVETTFLFSGIIASIFMILAVFIYSRFINPDGSFFVSHYFFPVVPVVILVTSYGTLFLYDKFKLAFGTDRTKLIFGFFFLFMAALTCVRVIKHNSPGWEPYKEVAEFIYEDSPGTKSAIVTTDNKYLYEGWRELYLTADNTRATILAYCLSMSLSPEPQTPEEILVDLKAQNYNRIYLCYLHSKLDRVPDWQVVMNWLRENYEFKEIIEDYKFRVLNLKQ